MSNNRQRADTVFVGGKVFTATGPAPVDAAVAIGGGRILAVADDATVRSLADADTEVVDLAGGLLVPGFQDAHVHPAVAGVQMLSCDLSEERSIDGYLAVVAAYAEEHPEAAWIRGGGWSMDVFPGARRRAPCSTRWCRTGPSCSPTGTATAPGSTPAPSHSRASTAPLPTRWTAGSSGTPTEPRPAPSRRAPWTWWPATCPSRRQRRRTPASSPRRSTSSPSA